MAAPSEAGDLQTAANGGGPPRDFLIEEFKALRAEMEIRIRTMDQVMIFSFLSVWIIYSYSFSTGAVKHTIWAAPLMLSAAGLFCIYNETLVRRLGRHIAQIERSFGYEGWETQLWASAFKRLELWVIGLIWSFLTLCLIVFNITLKAL